MTPSIATVVAAVKGVFPGVTVQINSCRPIAGTDTWSQHSWGNAADFFPSSKAQGDRIFGFLTVGKQAGAFPISTICWQGQGGCTTPHNDHIHVDGVPKMKGTPSCAGSLGAGSVSILDPVKDFFTGDNPFQYDEDYGQGEGGGIPELETGISELGLTANASVVERGATFLLGFAFVVVAIVLIAWELKGTAIGGAVRKAIK